MPAGPPIGRPRIVNGIESPCAAVGVEGAGLRNGSPSPNPRTINNTPSRTPNHGSRATSFALNSPGSLYPASDNPSMIGTVPAPNPAMNMAPPASEPVVAAPASAATTNPHGRRPFSTPTRNNDGGGSAPEERTERSRHACLHGVRSGYAREEAAHRRGARAR